MAAYKLLPLINHATNPPSVMALLPDTKRRQPIENNLPAIFATARKIWGNHKARLQGLDEISALFAAPATGFDPHQPHAPWIASSIIAEMVSTTVRAARKAVSEFEKAGAETTQPRAQLYKALAAAPQIQAPLTKILAPALNMDNTLLAPIQLRRTMKNLGRIAGTQLVLPLYL